MGEFIYRYGVMNSSKTANLLMTAYGYESYGRRILCLKSSLDTRWMDDTGSKVGKIESRAIPNSHVCELVQPTEDLYKLVQQVNNETLMKYSSSLTAVLVDEAQFLAKDQVRQLADVVDRLGIDVICFGLKNTYKDGDLFEGSSALVFYADSIEEIKASCKFCSHKATMNLRIVNGSAVYDGDSIQIGDVDSGAESYAQVCYHHYVYPPAPIIGRYGKRNISRSVQETLEYILKDKNPNGIYRKRSDVIKQKLSSTRVFKPDKKEDIGCLRYVVIGSLAIDLYAYAKTKGYKKLNSRLVSDSIIDFLYTYFENRMFTAFEILRHSEVGGIEFFENLDSVQLDSKYSTEDSKKRFKKLPDGHYYFYKYSTKMGWRFWESVLSGISSALNDIETIFYYVEEQEESN